MKYHDYYKVLEVNKEATQDQIKKAYRKLAKAYHPDANPNDKKAEEKFTEINEAYEVLGNEDKRRKYDQLGSQYNFSNGYDFDPSQFGYGGGNARYEFRGSGVNGFSDFFDMFFGDGGINVEDMFSSKNRGFSYSGSSSTRGYTDSNQTIRGEDKEVEIKISVIDGLKGTEKQIVLDTPNGRKTLSVKIPKGVLAGSKIRLAGQGGMGKNGGVQGDLFLVVSFKDEEFSLKGYDITQEIEVTPWTCALGGDMMVKTPEGKILVKIPEGIRSGNNIRIPGKGYYNSIGGRGDLFIKLNINNPKRLTEKQKELYEKLKDLDK